MLPWLFWNSLCIYRQASNWKRSTCLCIPRAVIKGECRTTPDPERLFSNKILDSWCWREIMRRHWALEKNAVKSVQILGLTRRVFAYLAWDPGFTPEHHQKKSASNMRKMKIMNCALRPPSRMDGCWWKIKELEHVPQGEIVMQSTVRVGGCWWEFKELDMNINIRNLFIL